MFLLLAALVLNLLAFAGFFVSLCMPMSTFITAGYTSL